MNPLIFEELRQICKEFPEIFSFNRILEYIIIIKKQKCKNSYILINANKKLKKGVVKQQKCEENIRNFINYVQDVWYVQLYRCILCHV